MCALVFGVVAQTEARVAFELDIDPNDPCQTGSVSCHYLFYAQQGSNEGDITMARRSMDGGNWFSYDLPISTTTQVQAGYFCCELGERMLVVIYTDAQGRLASRASDDYGKSWEAGDFFSPFTEGVELFGLALAPISRQVTVVNFASGIRQLPNYTFRRGDLHFDPERRIEIPNDTPHWDLAGFNRTQTIRFGIKSDGLSMIYKLLSDDHGQNTSNHFNGELAIAYIDEDSHIRITFVERHLRRADSPEPYYRWRYHRTLSSHNDDEPHENPFEGKFGRADDRYYPETAWVFDGADDQFLLAVRSHDNESGVFRVPSDQFTNIRKYSNFEVWAKNRQNVAGAWRNDLTNETFILEVVGDNQDRIIGIKEDGSKSTLYHRSNIPLQPRVSMFTVPNQ
ncbi:MAG: hypothetical protein R3351_02340 [Nitrospirales bacterium]|nr:hypothetical protein [Nitrospirales bacterium]